MVMALGLAGHRLSAGPVQFWKAAIRTKTVGSYNKIHITYVTFKSRHSNANTHPNKYKRTLKHETHLEKHTKTKILIEIQKQILKYKSTLNKIQKHIIIYKHIYKYKNIQKHKLTYKLNKTYTSILKIQTHISIKTYKNTH